MNESFSCFPEKRKKSNNSIVKKPDIQEQILSSDFPSENTVETLRIHETKKGRHNKKYWKIREMADLDFINNSQKLRKGTKCGKKSKCIKKLKKSISINHKKKCYKNKLIKYKHNAIDKNITKNNKKQNSNENTKSLPKNKKCEDKFSINNMILTPLLKRPNIKFSKENIQIPNYKILNTNFYTENLQTFDQNDSEIDYEELHKFCENREKHDKPPLIFT